MRTYDFKVYFVLYLVNGRLKLNSGHLLWNDLREDLTAKQALTRGLSEWYSPKKVKILLMWSKNLDV